MNPSKVYFTDLRTNNGGNLPQKLQRLIRAAGIGSIDMEKKFVAIKLHFGEPGNLSFLRPNYAKAVADVVKEQGGLPFLTDCNTLYVGRRKHALEHIEAAQENGFELFVPPLRLCGDNGAMVGAQGYYEYLAGHTAHSDLNAYATMEL